MTIKTDRRSVLKGLVGIPAITAVAVLPASAGISEALSDPAVAAVNGWCEALQALDEELDFRQSLPATYRVPPEQRARFARYGAALEALSDTAGAVSAVQPTSLAGVDALLWSLQFAEHWRAKPGGRAIPWFLVPQSYDVLGNCRRAIEKGGVT